MTQNMLKKIVLPLAATAALYFSACGENPIEIENKADAKFKWDYKIALDSIAQRVDDSSYYECYDNTRGFVQNNKERCDTFINQYAKNAGDDALSMKTIITMVRDSINYNDKGTYIGDGDDPKINYLRTNKMLSVTLTNYKRTAKSIEPEVRFLITTFIEQEPSEYEPLSALALDTTDIKEWKGEKNIAVQLPRGIDGMKICPVLRDKIKQDEYYDDEDLLDEKNCIEVKNLGWVEEDKSKSEKTSLESADIQWKWHLYAIK